MNVAHLDQTIRWDRSNGDSKHKGLGTDWNKLYSIGRDTSLILVVCTTLYFDCEEVSKGKLEYPSSFGVGRPTTMADSIT